MKYTLGAALDFPGGGYLNTRMLLTFSHRPRTILSVVLPIHVLLLQSLFIGKTTADTPQYNPNLELPSSCGCGAFLGCIWLRPFVGIEVPKGFEGVVEPILFVVVCLISVGLDKLVPGKSDALSIISYGLFALMSACTSRKPKLGFETGFFAFFLSLFSEQLFKTNWKLSPIALGFCWAAFLLRHRSQSGSDRPVRVIIETVPATQHLDLESQHASEQSLLLPNSNQETDDEEETRSTFPARRRYSPSNDGQVSEEGISEGGNEQNNEQEEDSTSSLAADSSNSSEQYHVSSANNQNGHVHSPRSGLFRRRRRRMTPVIQNSSLGDTLRRGKPCQSQNPYSKSTSSCGLHDFGGASDLRDRFHLYGHESEEINCDGNG
ncbi:hypothetical protein K1719_013128 [Acacia pycnantha]|nr:hypothetical protein K1719_013128 [Acacia pycnantha]